MKAIQSMKLRSVHTNAAAAHGIVALMMISANMVTALSTVLSVTP